MQIPDDAAARIKAAKQSTEAAQAAYAAAARSMTTAPDPIAHIEQLSLLHAACTRAIHELIDAKVTAGHMTIRAAVELNAKADRQHADMQRKYESALRHLIAAAL